MVGETALWSLRQAQGPVQGSNDMEQNMDEYNG